MERKKFLQKMIGSIKKLEAKKILMKISIGYISILLVVALFNTCLYWYLRPILIKDKMAYTENYLNYIGRAVDVEIYSIQKTMHDFLEHAEKISGQIDKPDVTDMMNLVQELGHMAISSTMLEYAVLYDETWDVFATSEGTESKTTVLARIAEQCDLAPEEFQAAIESNEHMEFFPVPVERGDQGSFVFCTGVTYSNVKKNKLIVFVSKKEISDMLRNVTVERYANTYILNEELETVLTLPGEILDKKKIDQHHSRYGKESMVWVESDVLNWAYVSVLDDAAMVKDLNFIKNIFLLMLFFMLLTCFIISSRFVKSYYAPIAKIVDNYLLVRRSTKLEGESISETLNIIQHKMEQYYEKDALIDILHSGFYTRGLEQMFVHNQFRVVMLCGTGQLSQEAILRTLVQYGEDIVSKLVFDTANKGKLILNGNDLNYNKTIALLLNLQQKYMDETEVFIACGISEIYGQIMELRDASLEAERAILYGNSGQESCLYTAQHINVANQSIYIPVEFERKMYEYIYVRDTESICAMIEEVFRQNLGTPNAYMHSVEMLIGAVYESICKKFGCSSKMSKEIVGQEYRIWVVEEYFKSIFTSIEGNGEKKNRSDAVHNYIMMYVKENYSDPTVSIETIAENMMLSPSYVSTLFKRSAGTSFSQYLLQYRLDIAKDLLLHTDEKISNISEKVGFGTYNNFVRMFKRKFGVSPSQYRLDEFKKKI